MKHTKGEWTVIDSGGRVMLKAVGEPQIICTLETRPLKITPEVQANASLIAAAPALLAACEQAFTDIVDILQLDENGIDPDGNDYSVWFALKAAIETANL